MKSTAFDNFDDQPKSASSGVSVDFKRVLNRAIRHWYVILLSTLCGLLAAWIINRYTTRVYPVTTSIIIREPAENADARFLSNNPLVTVYRNHYNEPYIIRSYPLVQSVVEELQLQVSFIKKGALKASEQYNLPVRLHLLNSKQGSFTVQFSSGNRFSCVTGETAHGEYSFGDTVECAGVKFVMVARGDAEQLNGSSFDVIVRDPEQVAGQFIGKLKVTWAEQGSSVVNLTINGPLPEREIDFLSMLIRQYQHYDMEKKSQAATRSLVFIERQLKDIGDTLQVYETALENFKLNNYVTDLSVQAASLYEELRQISDQKAQVVFASNYYTYLDNYLKRESDYVQIVLPSSLGISDGLLNSLVDQLVKLQTEYNLLLLNKSGENPLVAQRSKRLRDGMAEVKNQILEALANLKNTDRIKARGIEQQMERVERTLRSLPQSERRLVNIQRNYAFNESMFNFLQQKKAEAGISKASTTTDIIVVNPPRQSGGPITPKISQNIAAFGLAGFALPLIFFIVLEIISTKVQSREDVEKITTIPFLGGIGHKPIVSNMVVFEKPKSAMAEAFRALRSNLNYFTLGKDKKVFMVTSSLSGEGKTFTSINLATVFAMSGKPTLIIGADLRRPKLFDDFGLTNEKGLSTYLSGLHDWKSAVQATKVPNMFLLTGGPVPPNPSELLLEPAMDELMREVFMAYDYVILDTPPMALITDGLVLSKYADHTLYIIRQDYTPKHLIRFVDELYTSGKVGKVSLLLNDIKKTGPGYGYGQYNYGYYYYGYGDHYTKTNKKGDGYYE